MWFAIQEYVTHDSHNQVEPQCYNWKFDNIQLEINLTTTLDSVLNMFIFTHAIYVNDQLNNMAN